MPLFLHMPCAQYALQPAFTSVFTSSLLGSACTQRSAVQLLLRHVHAAVPAPLSCCTTGQVLYQVFDWPNQPGSRLAVIGISNTHDLDQRVLPRIASRLDQAKLAFAPYSVAQLQTIVGARLQDSGVGGAVEDMAIMLACRKVASETGVWVGV
jgi:hypothetical protein